MSEAIISRERLHTKGAAAFTAGKGRNDHNMNPGSAAIAEWQAGWDRFAALAKTGQASSASHTAPGARRHIDLCQGGAA